MKTDLQLDYLFDKFNILHKKHWDKKLNAIYGAWCINKPDLFFVFMNPTAKNISANKNWSWICAPRLGTKNIWKLFKWASIISAEIFDKIQSMQSIDWDPKFCLDLYGSLSQNKIYITNLAKCTQIDARPLHDKIFKEYLALMYQEITYVKPRIIITLWNQVSSILLGKNIKVSDYTINQYEELKIENKIYRVYPTFYPVWQGMRNMDKAIMRIKHISDL
jgi:DNA polymerase